MKLFHAALAVVGANPPQRPGRERLKSALAQKDLALAAVVASGEIVGRLRAVIDQSDDAARTAAVAAAEAKEARQRWVRDGCLANTREHHLLSEDAAKAATAAQSAGLDADAVSKELVRAQSVLQSAQAEVGEREQRIAAACGEIIAAEECALLRRYEQIAGEYRALRFQIMALQRVLDPGRYEDQGAKSHEGAQMVAAALGRGAIASWDAEREAAQSHDFFGGARGRDEGKLEDLVARWRARALTLRANPDAT